MKTGGDIERTGTNLMAAALFAGALLAPMAAFCAEDLTAAEAKAIAKEVFFWGMHPVAIYHLRYNYAQNEQSPRYVGINRLSWERTPMKALPRVATTPNATTLTATRCSICRRSLWSSRFRRSGTITGASSFMTIMPVGGA